MENRNVFVAICLSMAVLLFWGAFFETPKPIDKNLQQQNSQKKDDEINKNITPNIKETIKINTVSREDSINKDGRVSIENNNIIGSISLKGGLIDDVSFKNHKQDLKENKNVVFLNPKETKDGFFVETGWTSIGNKIKVPSADTLWDSKSTNKLSAKNPITLEWNNNNGIVIIPL